MDLLKSKILSFFPKLKKILAGFFLPIKKLKLFFFRPKSDLVSDDIDKKLVYSLSKTKIPSWSQLKHIGRILNRGEKLSLAIFGTLFFLSAGFLAVNFICANLEPAPAFGGEYTEAIVGAPQHINPLYASANDVDADISRLVFSSLFYLGDNGEPIGDLVENYEISPDGKIYTCQLKSGVHWHGGAELTAFDVLFTFNAIKDPAYNSPLRQFFSGIESEVKDDLTIVFILPEKYAPFLNLLTFGILPEEKWRNISPLAASLAEFNLKPEGSGPYKFQSLVKGRDGFVYSYRLIANRDYYAGRPNIKTIIFKFYNDIEQALSALNSGEVIGLSYLPPEKKDSLIAKNSVNINKLGLSQAKAIFFNAGNNPALKDVEVRRALSCDVPRADIINDVLTGDAREVYGPILPNNFAYSNDFEKCDFDFVRAAKILSDAGWERFVVTQEMIDSLQRKSSTSQELLSEEDKNTMAVGIGDWLAKDEVVDKAKKTTRKIFLTIRISHLNDEESLKTAAAIAAEWEKLGIKVSDESLSAVQLQSAVIKPRTYEALLFSERMGSDPDVYVFWHSSQAGKSGLNLSDYRSEEADKFLEQGRTSLSQEDRISNYAGFQKKVAQDVPAIFLYSPYYFYVQNKKIKNFSLENIFTPADRFNNASQWYIKSGWKIK